MPRARACPASAAPLGCPSTVAMSGLRVVVTTVIRHAPASRPTGFVYAVDLDPVRTLLRSRVRESRHGGRNPNPRGGLRGARGLGALGDRLVVANAESLFVYDPSWRQLAELTHPAMGNVHELLPEEEGIWVTCTGSD